MKRVLYLLRKGPGITADETTDLVLVSGVFGEPTSVVFADDAVYQLIGIDERQSALKALPTYEIDALYVHGPSLSERRIEITKLLTEGGPLALEVIDDDALRGLIRGHDVVLTD